MRTLVITTGPGARYCQELPDEDNEQAVKTFFTLRSLSPESPWEIVNRSPRQAADVIGRGEEKAGA